MLAACGGTPQAGTGVTPLPRPQPVPPEPPVPSAKPMATGLTPLPTPQQVVTAVPVGRPDPFLPPPLAAAAPAASAAAGAAGGGASGELPPGFRFSGVIVSAGQVQALAQLDGLSGSLRVGDRGGRSTDLLPSGWSVARIDLHRGVLTLRHGKRALALEL